MKHVYKVWGACLSWHAPFMMIIQAVLYSTTRTLHVYGVMWPYGQTYIKKSYP